MSKYMEMMLRFHRLKNHRVDSYGNRKGCPQRKIIAGRYIRLYATTIFGYAEYNLNGKLFVEKGESGTRYPKYAYVLNPKRKWYQESSMHVDTLIKYNVTLRLNAKTLAFAKEMYALVHSGKLKVHEAASIIDNKPLDVAYSDWCFWKLQDSRFEEMY